MAWVQMYWPYLLGAAIVVLMVANKAYASWHKGHKEKKRLADWYTLESKNFRELEKLWLASFEELKKSNTLVIPIIHDISFDFVPRDYQRQYLTVEEACGVMAQINAAGPGTTVEVILHTLGGDALAAEMVANALKSHRGKTRAYVPYIAMSAGTMIALAADELHMGSTATLGPIDMHYWGYPSDAWAQLRSGDRKVEDDTMYMRAYLAAKRADKEQATAIGLMNKKYKPAAAEKIVKELMKPSHHGERFPVKKIVDDLKIEVATGMPKPLSKFVDLRLRMLELYPKKDRDLPAERPVGGLNSEPLSKTALHRWPEDAA